MEKAVELERAFRCGSTPASSAPARRTRAVVKLTFAKGASLEDPSGLFNSSLEGNMRRAIDIHEGDKIDEKALKALIRAAVALNTSSRLPLAPSALRRNQRALEVSPPRPAGLARGRYLAGLAEQGSKGRLHRFEIEGLGQENWVFEPLALVEPAIAGGKCKGNAARAKRVGQRIAGVPAKIYVEDSAVQLPAGERKPVGDERAGPTTSQPSSSSQFSTSIEMRGSSSTTRMRGTRTPEKACLSRGA